MQGFEKRRVISSKKGFLSIFHSKNTFVKFDGSGLTLDNKLTAILKNKKLKFSSFHFIRQIFDMSAYYKEATDQDIIAFSKLDTLETNDQNAFINACDTWVRNKIGLIQQSGILEKSTVQQIASVAKQFNIDIRISGSDDESDRKIILPSDRAELKKLLRFLDEDYYKSPLTENMFISNSKRVAD